MKNFQSKANIARVSKIIRNVLLAGLVAWIIAIPVTLIETIILGNGASSLYQQWGIGPKEPAVPIEWSPLPNLYQKLGMPLLMVFCLIVNLKLFRFFDRLKNGHLFEAQTVANLDDAGRWWVALWFFESLFYGFGQAFFHFKNPPYSGGGLFTGLTLIFAAWLLKEAQELQEEQALTV